MLGQRDMEYLAFRIFAIDSAAEVFVSSNDGAKQQYSGNKFPRFDAAVDLMSKDSVSTLAGCITDDGKKKKRWRYLATC